MTVEAAEQFVAALNEFDGEAVGGMLAPDFRFTIGTHAADREEFLFSLATGPTTDPCFRFEAQSFEEEAGAVLVAGSQVYRWRETGEVATTSEQDLRLEFDGGLVVLAAVTPHPMRFL
ncbi:MAG TPA: nuclear transport factor 2 family protein [Gaiellaceae bacterium]|nr:nuclear transport factor 2 family protein [Gaiellaceae bacterium]